MMKFLEMIVITLALVTEFESLVKARKLQGQKSTDKFRIILEGYPAQSFMAVIFWLGSIGYLLYAISWIFSSNRIVMATALILLVISFITSAWKRFPLWWARLDHSSSMLALLIIGYHRFQTL